MRRSVHDPNVLSRIRLSRQAIVVFVALLVVALLSATWSPPRAAAAGSSCGANINPIVCENQQTSGVTPESVWDVKGSGDKTIQGFSTDISVNAGNTVQFKIDTTASAYTIDIYRLGYYGGNGARKITSVTPSAHLPQVQPPCATDPSTSLYDCGTWGVSASWPVPATQVSGVYIAKLTRTDTKGASQIPFVVRNDASTSDIVYQTSDETWEAYNRYGGSDFYTGSQTNLWDSPSRARKISYNRPFATRDDGSGRDFLFSNEYPTIRFLEKNGYDVSYITDVDTDRYGATQLNHHKVFLSVGHDEYWSQKQRTNVENARDAGLNLMFLSGNEVFWHTRFESSIDGSNTSYRTIVDYKDTWDNAPTDPSGEATATWRDPRFSTAPGGSNPENGLTGTMYMANTVDLPITVTSAQGKTRLWRGTGLNAMTGSSTALAPHTIGYESDEDVDNGFRPAGLIDLSTTVGPTPEYSQDFGTTVAPGTTTHHLTLYRAASGALVFGAGTIQWGWGLDSDHDGTESPADSRIQQATVNMLADMHTQPSTLMSGLVAATASTDTSAPVSTITSPVSNASIANGTQVTVTGTASDGGGGVVAGVEVSIDGGTTWHPATGTTSWSYTGVVSGNGSVVVKSRASDDSANVETPKAGITVNVACPCTIFGNTTPTKPDSGDASAVELGTRFTSSQNGYVTGVRFYKTGLNTGAHTGSLWTNTGTQLATGIFTGESASGWQTLTFTNPVQITKGTVYVASYFAPSGHYSEATNFFYYRDYAASPLSVPANSIDGTQVNGVYGAGDRFPTKTYQGSNYYVDPVFMDAANLPPGVSSTTPVQGAGGVPVAVHPTATFSTDVTPSSVVFTLKDVSGATVPGAVTYNATTDTATFTPTNPLATSGFYTASVQATDTSGRPMQAPSTWSFNTTSGAFVPEHCPCTFWDDSATPATVTEQDSNAVELGTTFSTDTTGVITGVRFYKGSQNTGVHTASLWSQSGQQLATATVTGESTSGWQQVSFSSPVAVTAGTSYVVSYHTDAGYYSATDGMFSTAGFDNFPLHIPTQGGAYAYGSGGFPSRASSSNYWVEPVFTVPTSTVPAVTSSSPSSGDTGVRTGSSITATFDTSVRSGTVQMQVSSAAGPVAGTASLNSTHDVATFKPTAALAENTNYTISVSGGVSLSGTAQTTSTWSFSTSGAGACPCSLFSTADRPTVPDAGADTSVTLGVQFSSATAGYVSGLRFYKSVANTGTHVGSLWSSDGTRLGQATFTNESASGWQTVNFSQPVTISANTTYVVGYTVAGGHYAADVSFFSSPWVNAPLTAPVNAGVFTYTKSGFPNQSYQGSNYWVDPIVGVGSGSDTTPPAVSSSDPLDGSTSQATASKPSAVFSEPITSSSLTFTLKNSSGTAVSGSSVYDAASQTATFTPDSALARGMTYTASVSASDTAGNAMTSPATWSFTTAQPSPTPGLCPCSVWDDAATPAVISENDPRSIELGTKFTADSAGQIKGVRFYKGPSNTGTHTVSLWSADGQLLASGTASGESTAGWQTALFTTPPSVTAGTTYLVSYHTSTGQYSTTDNAFSTVGVDSPPLHVPAHGGAYLYGAGFPATTTDTNFWVDPVFTTAAADTTAPAISAVAVTGSGTSATVTWTTDEPSTSRVDYGTTSTTLGLSATSATLVTSHSVNLTALTANTQYYFRVTSADAAGNSRTSPDAGSSPATYSPAVAPITDATSADFSAGTASSTYVAANGDGEVVLTPSATAEFTGTTLPTGWTSTATVTGGKSTVAGGTVTVAGAKLTTSATYTNGKAIETLATLDKNQSIGWASSSNANIKMAFTVNTSNQLVASVNDGLLNNTSGVAVTGWTTTAPHKFRIEWTSSAATFYVDDVQKYTHAFSSLVASSLRPQLADTATNDTNLVVDWLRVAPYAASGTFTSKAFDAGTTVGWDGLTWDSTVPANTALTVKVRTGNTATPDASWSAWTTVATSGASVGRSSRYVQYQLSMTSASSRFTTPTVRSVKIAAHAVG